MAAKGEFISYVPVLPGVLLTDELQERGISQKEFAKRIGMTAPNLNEYIKGKRSFTEDFCLLLEQQLGIPAHLFLGLQTDYNLTLKRRAQLDKDEVVALEYEQSLSPLLNVKALYKRLDITDGFAFFRHKRLQEILGFDPTAMNIGERTAHAAFKRSDKLKVDERNLRTWQLLAYVAACKSVKELTASALNIDKAARILSEEANGSEPLPEQRISEILLANGIGYSYVEKLPSVPVDGYSLWVEDRPAIVVTHRHNDLDRLLFTVLHELGHLALHEGAHIDTDCPYSQLSGKEREANEYAENMLIPKDKWNKIMRHKPASINPKSVRNTIEESAKALSIRPRLALHRYAYQTGMYTVLYGKAPAIE